MPTNPTSLLKPLFIAASLGIISLSPGQAEVKPGDTFPNLTKFALEGNLPKLKGNVILVDVFASWCKPCRSAFPVLDDLQKTYGPSGLTVLGISIDENQKDYQKFVAKQKPSFRTVRDARHEFANTAKPPRMPTSYIIDRKGKVRFLHKGFKGKKTQAEYIKEIEALLREI